MTALRRFHTLGNRLEGKTALRRFHTLGNTTKQDSNKGVPHTRKHTRQDSINGVSYTRKHNKARQH
jgi:hypothetical protein